MSASNWNQLRCCNNSKINYVYLYKWTLFSKKRVKYKEHKVLQHYAKWKKRQKDYTCHDSIRDSMQIREYLGLGVGGRDQFQSDIRDFGVMEMFYILVVSLSYSFVKTHQTVCYLPSPPIAFNTICWSKCFWKTEWTLIFSLLLYPPRILSDIIPEERDWG